MTSPSFTYVPAWTVTLDMANATAVSALGSLGSLASAQAVASTPGYQSSAQVFYPATINFMAGSSTSLGDYGNETLMPGQTSFATEWDNYVITATGDVYIPSAGNYTFDVPSDDGFSLTIPGADFTTLTNATNTTGGNWMAYDGGRGTADTLGVTYLNPGYYPVSLLYFQGGGPSSVEVSAAAGSFTAWNSTSFHLIGDTTDGGLNIVNDAYIAAPFTVAVNPLTTNSTSPTMSGTTSDSAASLSIRVNGTWYGVVNNNGAWSLPAGDILRPANGTYDVVVAGSIPRARWLSTRPSTS